MTTLTAEQAAFLAAQERAYNERLAQAEALIAKANLTPTMKRRLTGAYCGTLKTNKSTAKALIIRGLAVSGPQPGLLTLTFAGRIAHERALAENLAAAANR